MIAYACEGTTWGPRRRAAVLGGEMVAVGQGARAPTLSHDQRWRSVQWCSGSPLAGFDVVAGDPGVCVLAEPSSYVLAVTIFGQSFDPSCHCDRQPDAWWDAETKPLHGWAGQVLPTRGEVRDHWGCLDVPVVCVIEPSWGGKMLGPHVRAVVQPGVFVRTLTDARDLIGADFVIVAAGWSTTYEARWSGVPYMAVDFGMRDHPRRATGRLRDALRIAAMVDRAADLSPSHTFDVPDHREEFRAALSCAA